MYCYRQCKYVPGMNASLVHYLVIPLNYAHSMTIDIYEGTIYSGDLMSD